MYYALTHKKAEFTWENCKPAERLVYSRWNQLLSAFSQNDQLISDLLQI